MESQLERAASDIMCSPSYCTRASIASTMRDAAIQIRELKETIHDLIQK
jgi:hypothetical protein